jgi:hypothetical protein
MNRIVLFLGGCMVVRAAFALLAYKLPTQYLFWMAFPALTIAIGFLVLFLFRLRPTGREVNYERIWWDRLRPVHAMLYFGFAILALQHNRSAYLFLVADWILGLVAFTGFHALGWFQTF